MVDTRSSIEKYFLLSLVLSMSMLGSFCQPVLGNTVIVMCHDASVDISLRTLQQQTGPLHVVEYGSAEYSLIIHRLVGRVVWISHGSNEGIRTERGYLDWSTFAEVIDLTPAVDIVLACSSDNLLAFVKNPVITFGGSIDARFGAAIAAWVLTGSAAAFSFAFETLISLITNNLALLPLYWGPTEKAYFFLDAAVFILQALSTAFLLYWSTFNPASGWQILIGMLYLFTALVQAAEVMTALLAGNMTPVAFATKFLTVILPLVLRIMFGITPWWIQAIIVCEEVVAVATTVKIIALLISIIGCVFLVTGMLNDQADSDDIYGRWTF